MALLTFAAAPGPRSMRAGVRGLVLGALALGLGACGIMGGGDDERPRADLAASQVTYIGVNSYLWRASLETL